MIVSEQDPDLSHASRLRILHERAALAAPMADWQEHANLKVRRKLGDIDMLPVIRWQSVADFLVLAVAFDALLRWARSARAMRIALGVVGLHALALLAGRLDLVVTSWVLDASAILAILVLLLVFQPELRRAFMRLDTAFKHWPRPAVAGHTTTRSIVDAAFWLARYNIGALLVIARQDSITNCSKGASPLAPPSRLNCWKPYSRKSRRSTMARRSSKVTSWSKQM